jgi:MazG family protein
VVFHAQVAEDRGAFAIDEVARGITDKLVRRHPHVFDDVQVSGSQEVLANWEELKAAEKPERTGPFDGVPVAQPALSYISQLQSRAARLGFDWSEDREAAERVRLELDEFLAAGDDAARSREVGDLLMSVAGLARRHAIDPELALRAAAARFRSRFEAMTESAAKTLADLTRDEWLTLWAAAKDTEATSATPQLDP